MIDFISAKIPNRVIGKFVIKDEAQGWDETWELKWLPETRKSRAYEEGQEIAQVIQVKPLNVAGELVTCSIRDAAAAVFVSQSLVPQGPEGDKYPPAELLKGMTVSKAFYNAVYDAYLLICRDGEAIAQEIDEEDEEPPKE